MHGRIHDDFNAGSMGASWRPCSVTLEGITYIVAQDPREESEALPCLFILDGAD
jgi:hypothetical protein